MRILIVEDEKNLNRILTKKLTQEGYSVDSCFDGEEGLAFLESTEYDVVLLDIMLPVMDGMTVLKTARQKGIHCPIMMLTAKDAVSDKVAGLDHGADDYLTKPFALDELMARIRVLTRKSSASPGKTSRLGIADLEMDISSRTVTRGGQEISLSAKEFSILEYMILNRDVVLSREKIESHIWNYDYEGSSNMVDVYIRYLRKKIDEGHDKKLIHTVRGVGYVLKED